MTERIGVSEFDIPLGIYVPIEEYNKIKQQRDKLIEEYDIACKQIEKLKEACWEALCFLETESVTHMNTFDDCPVCNLSDKLEAALADTEDSE